MSTAKRRNGLEKWKQPLISATQQTFNERQANIIMSMTILGIGGAGAQRALSGASPAMAPQKKMSELFGNIDSSGAGAITQSQFAKAFQALNPPSAFKAAGANAVWSALDPNRTGQVSRQNFINVMKDLMVQLRQGPSDASMGANAAITGTKAFNVLGG